VPNPVTVADLVARFRPLSDVETGTAQALLDDAWELLTHNVPRLEARLSDGSLSPGLVRYVMRESIIPVLRNPDGVATWAVDDYSQTRDKSVSSGKLVISGDLIETLLPTDGSSSEAFTIRPSGAVSVYQPDPWASPRWS
jgi:hypothetical protein